MNVCPHRFSRITPHACGRAGEHLTCQYHGWEFACDGTTRRIPDAQSFRPMTRGSVGLKPYPTEVCGQLIFANFSDDPPPLREQWGSPYEECRALCGEGMRLAATFVYDLETNWKIKIENSIESYHVEMIHPKTFRRMPPAEACRHELNDRWASYSAVTEASTAMHRFLDRLAFRLARREPDLEYKQYLIYPNFMFGKMRLFSWAETIIPLSPSRARSVSKIFCYDGRSRGLRSRILTWALARWVRGFFATVGAEDEGIVHEVLLGHRSADHPSPGLISVREERCHHFQEYVKRATLPERPAAGRPHSVSVAARPCGPGHVGG